MTRSGRVIKDVVHASRRISDARDLADRLRGTKTPVAIFVGFSKWKMNFARRYVAEKHTVFLNANGPLISHREAGLITVFEKPVVYVWSCKVPQHLEDLCAARSIPMIRVEDGFIRSVGLGVTKTEPLSLVFDSRAMHFERNHASDLEVLLSSYDFDKAPDLMDRARELRDLLIDNKVSKYNFARTGASIDEFLPPGNRKRVLVLGQVEKDMSIRHGMATPMTNSELARRALAENPGAEILFRPHPEVSPPGQSRSRLLATPAEFPRECVVLPTSLSLDACLNVAQVVYTMTSLAGFEAALRGIEVVTFGMPFYAGWGFTTDRDQIARRGRSLSPLEVLAAAYLLYPRYIDPRTGRKISASDAAELIIRLLKDKALHLPAQDLLAA